MTKEKYAENGKAGAKSAEKEFNYEKGFPSMFELCFKNKTSATEELIKITTKKLHINKINKKMTIKEAIEILDNHNKWRRDHENKYIMANPKELGISIDIVLNEIEDLKHHVEILQHEEKYLKDKKEDDELSDIPNDAYALVSKDDFVWLPLTLQQAIVVFSADLFEVYELHDDGVESLLGSLQEIMETENTLAIEVGYIKK